MRVVFVYIFDSKYLLKKSEQAEITNKSAAKVLLFYDIDANNF